MAEITPRRNENNQMTNSPSSPRLICALDTTSPDMALALAERLGSSVGALKLGLEFFGACGPDGFARVAQAGLPIFLDLKLHDIPNTVAQAIHALMPLRPSIMTVHSAGGPAMMRAAAEAATEAARTVGCTRPLMVGVTILTSLDEDDLKAVGLSTPVTEQVVRMARLARQSGLDGVVCSPFEIAAIRKACGPDFTLVVPGIRPAGSATHDQKRVMTPAQAIALGADYLVIGRAITGASDPGRAARDIAAEMTGS